MTGSPAAPRCSRRAPGRILPALLTFANRHFRRPVRIVGEPIWAGRSPAEIVEAIRHEALLNLAFAGTAVEVLCPSETNALAADVVSAARRTHPTIMSHGRYTVSPSYADPAVVTTTCDQVRLSEPATARTPARDLCDVALRARPRRRVRRPRWGIGRPRSGSRLSGRRSRYRGVRPRQPPSPPSGYGVITASSTDSTSTLPDRAHA